MPKIMAINCRKYARTILLAFVFPMANMVNARTFLFVCVSLKWNTLHFFSLSLSPPLWFGQKWTVCDRERISVKQRAKLMLETARYINIRRIRADEHAEQNILHTQTPRLYDKKAAEDRLCEFVYACAYEWDRQRGRVMRKDKELYINNNKTYEKHVYALKRVIWNQGWCY